MVNLCYSIKQSRAVADETVLAYAQNLHLAQVEAEGCRCVKGCLGAVFGFKGGG